MVTSRTFKILKIQVYCNYQKIFSIQDIHSTQALQLRTYNMEHLFSRITTKQLVILKYLFKYTTGDKNLQTLNMYTWSQIT